MKIEGQYILPGTPADVWERLNDPKILAKTFPGGDVLEPDGPDHYKAQIKYKMGPVSGTFNVTLELSEKVPPKSMHLKTNGRGGAGFINADGQMELVERGKNTEVQYTGNFQFGGLLAAMGSRMMESMTKESIDNFFQAVAASLRNRSA